MNFRRAHRCVCELEEIQAEGQGYEGLTELNLWINLRRYSEQFARSCSTSTIALRHRIEKLLLWAPIFDFMDEPPCPTT
jgi:hypothetical protein